jgi:hypothetical protein
MKNTLYILSILLLLGACSEKYEISTTTFNSKIVVNGLITNTSGPNYVRLTKSISQTSTSTYGTHYDDAEPIQDALVIITDDIGTIDTLTPLLSDSLKFDYNIGYFTIIDNDTILVSDFQYYEIGGFYRTNLIKGVPCRQYNLYIYTDGSEYSAIAYMPPVPEIDSLSYEKKISEKDGEEYYIPLLYFSEPQNMKNYYLIKLCETYFCDNLLAACRNWEFSILSDEFLEPYVNGLNVDDGASPDGMDFYYFSNWIPVRVSLYSLTYEAYEFYRALISQFENDGGTFKPSPASPPSNISNGALGIFRASALDTMSIIMNEHIL